MSFPLASTTAPPSPLAGTYGAVPASHTNSSDDSGPSQLSSTQRHTASPSTDQQQQQQRLQRALQYDGALAALSSAAVLSNASAAANNNGSSPSQQGALTPHTIATSITNESNYRPFFIDASDVARVHEVVESLSRRLSATTAQLSASVADRRAMGVRLLQCEAALQIVSAENARLHAYAEGYLAPLHAMQSEIVRRERAEAAALLLSAKEGARERERQLRREAAASRREAGLMRGVMGASPHGRRLLVDVDAELEALRTREPSLFAGGAGAGLSSSSPTSSPHHAAALAPVSASVYHHHSGGGGGASSSSISAAGWVGNGRADGGGGNARRKTADRAASPPSQPQPSRSSSAAAAARRGRSQTPTRGGWRAGGGSASSNAAGGGGGGVLGAGRPPSPSTSVRYGQQMYADATSLRRAVSAAGGPLAAAARDLQQQLAGVGGAGQQQQRAAAVGGASAAVDFSLMDEDVLLDDFDLTPIPKATALGGRRHEAAAVAASPKHAAPLNVPTGGKAEDLLLADALSLSPQRQPQRAAALGAAKTNKQQPLAYAFGGANADGIRQFLSQRDDRIAALEAENSRLLQQVSSSLMLL